MEVKNTATSSNENICIHIYMQTMWNQNKHYGNSYPLWSNFFFLLDYMYILNFLLIPENNHYFAVALSLQIFLAYYQSITVLEFIKDVQLQKLLLVQIK